MRISLRDNCTDQAGLSKQFYDMDKKITILKIVMTFCGIIASIYLIAAGITNYFHFSILAIIFLMLTFKVSSMISEQWNIKFYSALKYEIYNLKKMIKRLNKKVK